MIIEWLVGLAEGFVISLIEFFNFELVPQEAVLDVGAGIAPWAHGIADLGVWLPWGVLAVWVPAVSSVYIGSLTIKFVKNLLSHVPFVGGKG